MTPEVKERIERIRQGHVPEGYKKTKVGIFPCEWDVQPLNKLLEFKNGINADKEKFGQGTKLISVRDILSDYPITYETIKSAVDINEQQIEEFGVKYGDVLFQRSSENYEDAGTSNVYLDPNNTAVFSGFVIRGKKISEYNPLYLNALLRTSYVRKAIIRQAAGAQHINIGQESLAKVHIALADDSEQTKIAEILTAQNKVIELKEKLLAEKQRQKKYLMQQLLTGRKRLPGFEGEWKCSKLINISTYRASSITANSLENYSGEGLYPIYDANSVLCYVDYFESEKPYVSIVKDGAGAGRVALSVGKSSVIGTMGYIFPSDQTLVEYLYYCLTNMDFSKYCNGSTIPHVYYKDYGCEQISLPCIEEQQAIISVLISSDKEISLLSQDIEQEKQKKKALMQLLLTGIVRV